MIQRIFIAGLTAAFALAVAGGTGTASASSPPPWEPDPNAIGSLTLYDAAGNVITAGAVSDAPFAAYVQGSHAGRSGDTKATIFGYLPQPGVATGSWPGEQMSASTTYPNSSAPASIASSSLPLVTLGSTDETIQTLATDFPHPSGDPSTYQGAYQLRLKTSGTGQTAGSTYDAVDILITGSNWQVAYPAPTTTATTTSVTASPASPQSAGTPITLTATITPSAAPGSVQFADGSTALGSPVAVSGGTAVYTTSSLSVGSHSFTAAFTPANPASNPNEFAGSASSAVAYTINPAPAASTSTALSVNTGSGVAFSPVTFTATVTPSGAPGAVTFTDGSTTLGTTAAGSGTFTFTTSSLGQGSHTITATFNPTDTSAFQTSSATAPPFTLSAPQYVPATGNIQAEIPPGTLVITTPYSSASSPLDLGPLALNTTATQYSASATLNGISITDTRAGNLPWTVAAQSSNLTGPSSASINSQNVGLTNLIADPVAGNALTAASVTTTDNPAASPAVAPTASGSAGVGGGVAHAVLSAAHGEGSIGFHGTLTLNAPTSSPPGTYDGTITFTIS